MKLSSNTTSSYYQCPDTQVFFGGGWGGGMENKSSKVCEMLALLLVLYDSNHKADFTNHKTDNRKKCFEL